MSFNQKTKCGWSCVLPRNPAASHPLTLMCRTFWGQKVIYRTARLLLVCGSFFFLYNLFFPRWMRWGGGACPQFRMARKSKKRRCVMWGEKMGQPSLRLRDYLKKSLSVIVNHWLWISVRPDLVLPAFFKSVYLQWKQHYVTPPPTTAAKAWTLLFVGYVTQLFRWALVHISCLWHVCVTYSYLVLACAPC